MFLFSFVISSPYDALYCNNRALQAPSVGKSTAQKADTAVKSQPAALEPSASNANLEQMVAVSKPPAATTRRSARSASPAVKLAGSELVGLGCNVWWAGHWDMLTDQMLTGVNHLRFCSDSRANLPKLLYEARCYMQVHDWFGHHDFSHAVSCAISSWWLYSAASLTEVLPEEAVLINQHHAPLPALRIVRIGTERSVMFALC